MPTVPLLTDAEVAPEVGAAFAAASGPYGKPLGTWRAIAHRPEAFAAYLPYLRAVAGPGVVEQRTKELAALEVALLGHCRYSAGHRTLAARRAGVTDAQLEALGAEDRSAFGPRERAALDLAGEMTRGPGLVGASASRTGVEPAVLAAARELFSDAELVELCLDIALWNALLRFHRVMDLEDDLEPPPACLLARLG